MDAKERDSREIFSAAFSGDSRNVRAPFWVMRQAGRYLPEYRALKEKHGFLGIVHTPELAAEATLQPLRRFGFDCAILFCDILALSEALGFPYSFRDKGGIELSRTVRSAGDLAGISASIVREKLSYVASALKILRGELSRNALIGFCASPFTLLAYMVEGGSSNGEFPKFKKFIEEKPKDFAKLLEALTIVSAEYLKMQSECGIDAFQIFDSHASLAPVGKYAEYSGKYIAEVLRLTKTDGVRSILFAPAMSSRFGELLSSARPDAYSVDSSMRISSLAAKWDVNCVLQGNLNPLLLTSGTPDEVARETLAILNDAASRGKHIFNLGHGIRPDAKLENVEAMCATVKGFVPSKKRSV